MSNTIELFMWGYQQNFQILAQIRARNLFQDLDKNLIPDVFLVGILSEETEGRHPVCLEPEDCGYSLSQFAGVIEQAKHFEAVDEENNYIHSHSLVQQRHKRRIKIGSLKKAVQAIVNRWDMYEGYISFVSSPSMVEGYQVFTVLRFRRDIYTSHYSLKINLVERQRISLRTSLLDSTIIQFLAHCREELSLPEPGAGIDEKREGTELIRSAGRDFMFTPGYAGGEFEGVYGLFHACNTISSLRYEGAEGIGKMLIARRGHPNIKVDLALSSTIKISDYRAVRKLLEMSSSEVSLLTNSFYIYGLGRQIGQYDHGKEDLFSVNFTKHYAWELVHAGHIMMQVAYQQPHLPTRRLDEEKFRRDIPRIFPDVKSQEIEDLWQLILEAIEQKHGTMVVVSSDAKSESIRLGKQCIQIEPTRLSIEMMKLVTTIDGAVLIDHQSTCFAIGVILDGLASEQGNSARGARYNSAIRYVEGRKQCLAIVVSEDGSIDLIPNLRPQLRRSLIANLLEKLRNIEKSPSLNGKVFNHTLRQLEAIQFYLSQEICDEINQLRKDIQAKIPKEAGILYVIDNDLVAHEEMNASYLLDE